MASRKRNQTPQVRAERQFNPRVVLRVKGNQLKIDTNMADTEEAWKMVFKMLSVAGGQVANRLGVPDRIVEVVRPTLVGPDGKPLN